VTWSRRRVDQVTDSDAKGDLLDAERHGRPCTPALLSNLGQTRPCGEAIGSVTFRYIPLPHRPTSGSCGVKRGTWWLTHWTRSPVNSCSRAWRSRQYSRLLLPCRWASKSGSATLGSRSLVTRPRTNWSAGSARAGARRPFYDTGKRGQSRANWPTWREAYGLGRTLGARPGRAIGRWMSPTAIGPSTGRVDAGVCTSRWRSRF